MSTAKELLINEKKTSEIQLFNNGNQIIDRSWKFKSEICVN